MSVEGWVGMGGKRGRGREREIYFSQEGEPKAK